MPEQLLDLHEVVELDAAAADRDLDRVGRARADRRADVELIGERRCRAGTRSAPPTMIGTTGSSESPMNAIFTRVGSDVRLPLSCGALPLPGQWSFALNMPPSVPGPTNWSSTASGTSSSAIVPASVRGVARFADLTPARR